MIKLNKKYKRNGIMSGFIILLSMIAFTSCEDNILPEIGSIEDLTPPTANFSYVSTQTDFRTILFTNTSSSASTFSWDFGGGDSSTEKDPTYTFTGGEGTYPVTLTSSDGNGVTSTVTLNVEVVDLLIPVFLCPSFECSDRSVWSDGNGSTYSGSGSPTPPDGSGGAKIGANSTSQYLDQTILVSPGTTYTLSFWFVSKSSGTHAGRLLVEDADDNTAYIQENVPLSASTSAYEPITYTFTTNVSTAGTQNLRFYMQSGDVESRYDLVELTRQ